MATADLSSYRAAVRARALAVQEPDGPDEVHIHVVYDDDPDTVTKTIVIPTSAEMRRSMRLARQRRGQ